MILSFLTILQSQGMVHICKNILAPIFKNTFFSRLAFSKDTTVNTTAGATVRHLVSAVYDRAMSVKDTVPATSKGGLADLPPTVTDAYMLFQDLIQLVNADQPIWLQVQID